MFFYIIGVIIVWIIFAQIFRRLNRIEKELGISKQEQPSHWSEKQSQQAAAQQATTEQSAPQPDESWRQTADTDAHPDQLIEWIKENWLMKVGALLILIAFGWFVSYAFVHNWIGPVGRIGLGLAAGAVLLIAGKLRMAKKQNQGIVTMILGSTTILLSLLAGHHIYNFFTPLTMLSSMLVVTIGVGIFSVTEKSKALAISSIGLAAITPALLAANIGAAGLLSYVTVIVAGTIWVVALTKWRALTLVALGITVAYCLSFLGAPEATEQIALWFVYGFSILFFGINILHYLQEKTKVYAPDVFTTLITGALLLIWILVATTASVELFVLLAWAVLFSGVVYLLHQRVDTPVPVGAYGVLAGTFLATATWVTFSGAALTIAYALEIFFLLMLVSHFTHRVTLLRTLSLLHVVPIMLSMGQITSSAWNSGILHVDSVTLVILIAIFVLSAMHFFEHIEADSEDAGHPFALTKLYTIFATGYTTLLVWLSLHAVDFISTDLASGIALSLYTIVGLTLYYIGKRDGRDFLRYLGLVFVWGVVARLMFVEFWMMDTAGKIVTFLIIGGLFFVTAFFAPDDSTDRIEE